MSVRSDSRATLLPSPSPRSARTFPLPPLPPLCVANATQLTTLSRLTGDREPGPAIVRYVPRFSRARHFIRRRQISDRGLLLPRARVRMLRFLFPRAQKSGSPRCPEDTSIISPADNVPVGACWTEGRNAAGPGTYIFFRGSAHK